MRSEVGSRGPIPPSSVVAMPTGLLGMKDRDLIRYAEKELNFYVDVNAPPEQMRTHLLRNSVSPAALEEE